MSGVCVMGEDGGVREGERKLDHSSLLHAVC